MTVTVSNIALRLSDDQNECYALAQKRLGVPAGAVLSRHISRRAVDARRRSDIRIVYSVTLELAEGAAVVPAADVRISRGAPAEPPCGTLPLEQRPVVIGFGPAGIFCALYLARRGYRPLVLERGPAMPQRVREVEGFFSGGELSGSGNVQFGEGGAGSFSDGKLTTRIGDPECEEILRIFAAHGAPQEILTSAKPHIGTDILRGVVVSLRREIEALGGEVRFLSRVDGFGIEGGILRHITVDGERLPVSAAVLAMGHSARDTFEALLCGGVAMEPKPFAVGARIEHLQTDIDRSLYGDFAGHPLLPRGEYQLSHREPDGRAVYTFCMCPGGVVVPAASEPGGVVTNGMSYHARDGSNANSALVVSVSAADFGNDPLSGMAFQRRIERAAYAASGGYAAPAQTVGRFLAGESGADFARITPSYSLGVAPCALSQVLPRFVAEEMKKGLSLFSRRIACFADGDAVLTAPETRTSSPLRVPRRADGQSVSAAGLYPCGEGCGYAGGIMSAAADGVRAAKNIVSQYKPFD